MFSWHKDQHPLTIKIWIKKEASPIESPPDPKTRTLWGLSSLSSTFAPLNSKRLLMASLADAFSSLMRSRNTSKRHSVSSGPAECSGWNWVVNIRLVLWTMPSLVLSLALVKRGDQPMQKEQKILKSYSQFL